MKQNALITVDQKTGDVTMNGEYYVMRHFSQFVKPGAKRVLTTGVWGDKIAFVNPDGSVVAVLANTSNRDYAVKLAVAGAADTRAVRMNVPAHSVNTFVLPPIGK